MMRKSILALRLVALILCASALVCLCGCSKSRTFVADGSKLTDKNTNTVYEYARLSFEPIALGESLYGESEDMSFYKIEGKDPLEWIATEDGTVFHSTKVKMPTLPEMKLSYVDICTEGKDSIKVNATVNDALDIAAIVDAYTSAQSIYYSGEDFEVSYKIRFADTELGLYYSMTFIRYANDYTTSLSDGTVINHGRDFLFDRYDEKRFVTAPEELVKYIDELA